MAERAPAVNRTCHREESGDGGRVQTFRMLVLAAGLIMASVAVAQQELNPGAARVSDWNGYQRLDFTVEGRPCVLVLPKTSAPNKPWIWRTEFFGVEPQVDLALLARGWHVAFMDARDLYGGPPAMRLFGNFYAHIVAHAGLARRAVLEGFSRGGLYAVNFAATHPSRVAALYLDGAVLDLRSWPGRNRESREYREMLAAYQLNEETFAAFRRNPIDLLQPIATAKIPIIAVAGDADEIVPFADNTGILEKRFRDAGGLIEVIVKPGGKHQPHSLPDPTPIVDFLLKNARP